MRALFIALAVAVVAVSAADLAAQLRREYPAGTRVGQLALEQRVTVVKAFVATDARINALALDFALTADDEEGDVADSFRFASASARLSAEDAALDELFASRAYTQHQLHTDLQRFRFRVLKAELMAEAERQVRARHRGGPLSLFGDGDSKQKKDKAMMNTGIGSLFGKVADKAKSVAHSTPIVGDVVKRAEKIDIHKLSGTVAKVAGTINTVSGALSPVLTAATVATAAVPGVGEVVGAAAVANTAIGVGSGVVATGAELIHDNTKEGETLGQALGRAKDYAVAVGNDPTKLARDGVALIKRKIEECKKDPMICVKLGLKVGSMAASIAGQGGLSKGMKLGANAIDIVQKIKAADAKSKSKSKSKSGKGKGKDKAKGKGNGKGKTAAFGKGKGKGKLRASKGANAKRPNGKGKARKVSGKQPNGKQPRGSGSKRNGKKRDRKAKNKAKDPLSFNPFAAAPGAQQQQQPRQQGQGQGQGQGQQQPADLLSSVQSLMA